MARQEKIESQEQRKNRDGRDRPGFAPPSLIGVGVPKLQLVSAAIRDLRSPTCANFQSAAELLF
jgi:hypothetical protein